MKSFRDKVANITKDIQTKASSNPQVNSAAFGAYSKGSAFFQTAFNFAKGVVPGGPLKATFANISNVPLSRTGHTIAVVKGRAYVFGGEEENGKLASNDMHVVILPSSGVLQADYTSYPARPRNAREGADTQAAVPSSRRGHSAAVVGDDIYVFGGEDGSSQPVDSDVPGRVWVYDTTVNAWNVLDPASTSSSIPPSRSHHGAATSDEPQPRIKAPRHDPLPQQPLDPSKTVPEVAEKDSWGTLIIAGGRNTSTNTLLSDIWAFDIRTRTWSTLPSIPGPARTDPSLAISNSTLFLFGGHDGTSPLGGSISRLPLTSLFATTSTLQTGLEWTTTPFHHGSGPRERSHAGISEITTGQGRHYLLLIGGETTNSTAGSKAYFDDVWTYQLPAGDARTVAGIKDAAQGQVNKARGQSQQAAQESDWVEVKYQYYDAQGDVREYIVGQTDEKRGRGVGSRGGFAVARGTEVDGASVVVWGGVNAEGRVLGDGWLISVER